MPEIELSPRAKIAAIVAVLALVLLVLFGARDVLAPFAWAFVAAYVVHPSVAWLVRRTGLPRLAIVGALYVALLTLFAFAIRGLVPSVQRELFELRLTLPGLADALEPLNGRAAPVLGIQLEPHAIADTLARATAAADLWVRDNAFGLGVRALQYAVKLLLFLVATFYLLLQWDRLGERIRLLTPPEYRAELGALAGEIDAALRLYLRGLLVLVALMSAATWLALTLLGVRFALLLGLATGVLDLVPVAGPLAAASIAITVGVVQGSPLGWSATGYAAAIAVVYVVLRYLEDYLVIPYVLGRAVDVHPLILIFAVIVGAELFGLGGAMLAAPFAGVLRVLAGWLSRKLLRPPAPRPPRRRRPAYPLVYPRARLRRDRVRPGPGGPGAGRAIRRA